MAWFTFKARSAMNASPPDPKYTAILALTKADVFIQAHHAMLLNKDLMIIHRNPSALVAQRRLKIAVALFQLQSPACLQASKNTRNTSWNFGDPLIAFSVFVIVCLMVELPKHTGTPKIFRPSTTTWTTILAHKSHMVQLICLLGVS